jgi:DNA invertase Pin-like site-specific DNA recombinase
MRNRRPLTIDGPMGRMALAVLGMIAEMELGFIRHCQRAGIGAAKAKGVCKGRPATFNRARILALRKEGWAPRKSEGSRVQAGQRLQSAQGCGVQLGWQKRSCPQAQPRLDPELRFSRRVNESHPPMTIHA